MIQGDFQAPNWLDLQRLHHYHLGDIGVPVDPNPMDFSAWFEAFLDGRWYKLDARHNNPRIGRIVMGRGRDASDVAISTAFGIAKLARFEVVTQEHSRDG